MIKADLERAKLAVFRSVLLFIRAYRGKKWRVVKVDPNLLKNRAFTLKDTAAFYTAAYTADYTAAICKWCNIDLYSLHSLRRLPCIRIQPIQYTARIQYTAYTLYTPPLFMPSMAAVSFSATAILL